MAFQTGVSTTIENLLQALSTFLTANGWTESYANTGDPGTIAFTKNSVFVAFQYSETAEGGDGTMAMYQSTAHDAIPTTDPWTSTGDSGNGEDSNTINSFDTQRCVNVVAGPHTAYWFFENDAGPAYCHIVVEVDAGRFRHFGFGEIDKIGDWVGGEYVYGHFWNQAVSDLDNPNDSFHSIAFDSHVGTAVQGATMRVEGHAGEPEAATVYATWTRSTNPGTDRAGNLRWKGSSGWRGGREYMLFQNFRISEATGFKPMVPVSLEISDTSITPDSVWRIGYQADVRLCNIGNLADGQIINIAGDNWYFFPVVRKQFLQNDTEETRNAGIAYRRIDA